MGLLDFFNRTTETQKSTNRELEKPASKMNSEYLQSEACAADMSAIKDIWPFGTNEFKIFEIIKDNKGEMISAIVKYAWLQPNGKGAYALSMREFRDKDIYKWTLIVKNNKMFLKDENGEITVLNSLSFDLDDNITFLFNPDDDRYKKILSKIESISSIKKLHLYRGRDYLRFLEGKMDQETLETIADRFEFIFDRNTIASKEFNMGSLFADTFWGLSKELNSPLAIRKETYDYLYNYGVSYVWDEQSFQDQWIPFQRTVGIQNEDMSTMCKSSWNLGVYWAGGMVYECIKKLIESSSLPCKLNRIFWDGNKVTYEYELSDSIFNYNWDIPDERSWLGRALGTENEYQDSVEGIHRRYMEALKGIINIILSKMRVKLCICNETDIVFSVFNDEFGGLLGDAVIEKPSGKNDNNTQATENKEILDVPVSKPIMDNESQHNQQVDAKLDFDEEALKLLKNGMKLGAVKRCSEVYGISLAEAMKKVDAFTKEHPEIFN